MLMKVLGATALVAALGLASSAHACYSTDINGVWKAYFHDTDGSYRTTIVVKDRALAPYRPVLDNDNHNLGDIVGGYARVNKHCVVRFKLKLDNGDVIRTRHAVLAKSKSVINGLTRDGALFTAVKKEDYKDHRF